MAPGEGIPRARRPEHPERVRAFMYACAKVSAIMDERMKNTNDMGRAAVAAIRAHPTGEK